MKYLVRALVSYPTLMWLSGPAASEVADLDLIPAMVSSCTASSYNSPKQMLDSIYFVVPVEIFSQAWATWKAFGIR